MTGLKKRPGYGFDVFRRASDEWHTVKMTDEAQATLKKRPIANTNGKSVNGVEPGEEGNASTPAPDKV